MSDIKCPNDLVSGLIDSPDMLFKIEFHIVGITSSGYPYYLAPVKYLLNK